jgi:adhesin transport system outer membrane protein
MNTKQGKIKPLAAMVAVLGMSASLNYAQAQEVGNPYGIEMGEPISDFFEAVRRAVVSSPRVNAEYYNFEAANEAQRGARGGYLPSVDLYSEWGREEREAPLIDFDGEDYSRDATRLSITQMLFDGFKTRDEVNRLGYEKLNSYYDLQRASQEVALEATSAFLEVLKFQKLVGFAEDNLEVHERIYDKIEERAGSGVSQGVDLEQARARVALAESNLVTERTNLYAVNRQFQRVVGVMPADQLELPEVSTSLVPDSAAQALDIAYTKSPQINAAIENLRATQQALNKTNSPMMPRLDLRYRNEIEHDTDGFEGRYEEEAIEVVLSYNLYRGGTDSARKREFFNYYNAAIEERKQACLNVRQEVTTAYNEVQALEDQVRILERNMLAQDKTRRAYRDQFDLGQRTLLDLLDSQNEYFDTQRTFLQSRADLARARARIVTEMGLLLAAFDIDGVQSERIAELELDLSRDPDDENAHHLCPPAFAAEPMVNQEELREDLAMADADTDTQADAAAAAALAGLAAGSARYQAVEDGTVVEIELDVKFELNSSVISSNFDGEISKASMVLQDNPSIHATVEGHTDTSGTAEYNQWLSERRAESVRDVMVNDHGVDPDQVVAVGMGEDQPIADNSTREGREANRRVELMLDANGN